MFPNLEASASMSPQHTPTVPVTGDDELPFTD
jgi:hypothetical protein